MDAGALAFGTARLGSALALVVLVGCESLGLDSRPDNLELDVEAVGTSEISVVTSTTFSFVTDPDCETGQCEQSLLVLDADTVAATAPLHRTYAFTSAGRYLVEVFPADGVEATLSMRVRIDGKEWFNDARELKPVGPDGEQETLLFTYAFAKAGAS